MAVSVFCSLLFGVNLWQAKPPQQTTIVSASNPVPQLEAELVPPAKALARSATVNVKVHGVRLVEPSHLGDGGNGTTEKQAYLSYRIDDGPGIATAATYLSFHNLPSGDHRITVTLVGTHLIPLISHGVKVAIP